MAEFATLVLKADTTGLAKGREEIEQTTQAANKNEKATVKMAAGFNKAAMAAAALGAAAVVAVGSLAFRGAIREAEQLERNMLRTNAIITATGGAAGKTAKQLHEQARALALTTLASTEGVMKAQQTLLTFRNIRGQVFDDAIKGAMDLAAAMGTDLNSATLQLAKALEDPVKGMSALTRSGTVFTDAQKEMVKGMVAVGDTAKAQQFILGELAAQYGGIAAIEAAGLAGAQDTLAQRQQEFLIALNDTLGLTALATAANTAMAAGVLFLTDNVNELVGIIGAAAAAALLAYTPAIWGAVASTAAWVASLVTLRGALLATGVGALVVVAGLLIGKFLDLVESAGGFGKAMGLLGNVASAVFAYIVTAAQSVPYSLKGVWLSIQASFASMAMAIQQIWASVISSIAGTTMELINSIPDAVKPEMLDNLGAGLEAAANRASSAVAATSDEISVLTMRSETYTKMAQNMRDAAGGDVAAAIQKLGDVVAEESKATDAAAESTETLNDSLNDLGGSGGAAGKAGKALEKAATEAEAYNKALSDAALTAEDLGTAKANILTGGIDSVSNAFGDFVARGFKDFKGFAKSILSTFTGMLSQMIALAAKNRIMVGLGISAGGAGGAVAAGQPGGGGAVGTAVQAAGGMGFGGIGTAVSTFGTAALGGFTNALGATLSGGLGMGFASIGGQVGAAIAAPGLASIGAAVGAVALPVMAVIAAITFFKKKVTELDRGINFAAENMAVSIEGYKKINTKKYWGLSSKDTEEAFDGYDAGIPPMIKAANEIQTGIVDAAAALGIGAEAFDNFSYSFQSSFKDMTDEQIQAELTEKFRQLGHDFAVLIPGLEGLTKEGELASDTLYALVNSLNTVNGTFELLGLSMQDASLEGAAMAQAMVNVFGSLENLNTATTAYYQAFYSDSEKVANAAGAMRNAMAELGETMPATREGFRALVEQADAMGDPMKVAKLISLAGAFDQVITSVDSLTTSLAQSRVDALNATRDANIASAQAALSIANDKLATAKSDLRASFGAEKDRLRAEYDAMVAAIQASQQENTDAITAAFDASMQSLEGTLTDARERLALSQSIADALDDALRNRLFPGVDAQRLSQDRATAYLAEILANGEANDIDRLNDALSAIADPSTDTYKTLEEYRLDFDRQTAIISQLKGNADIAMSADAMMVEALEGQLDQAQINHDAQMVALEAYHAEELDIEQQLLDQQIAALDEQMNALLGINTSVLSIGDAIINLAAAVAAQEKAQKAVNAAQAVPKVEMPKSLAEIQRLAVEQIYQEELGRAPDAPGMAWYLGNLTAGKTDIGLIRQNINKSTEGTQFDKTGIPKFASGGRHSGGWRMVGENGPELEFTGPSQIASNSKSRTMLDNSAVVAELQQLKPILASIARSTGRTSYDLGKWDTEGLPGTAVGEVLKTEAV